MKERLAFKVQNGDKEKDDPQIVDLFSLSLSLTLFNLVK